MCLLKIKNLNLKIKKKIIIKKLNLKIKKGEIHFLLGKNGSGKSILALTIAGKKKYISKGKIFFKKKNINKLTIDKIAKNGLFVSFQNNVEISGLKNQYFLYECFNNIREYRKKKILNIIDFKKLLYKKIKKINIDKSLLKRSLNKEFSGGEKKKNEILQILLLNPKLIILDEIDSFLDKKTLKKVIYIIKKLKKKKKSFLIITHNKKFIKKIKPNYIHIINKKKIKKYNKIKNDI